ncbi:hypothetical protein SprV_0100359100 [Sparganum proliferum]
MDHRVGIFEMRLRLEHSRRPEVKRTPSAPTTTSSTTTTTTTTTTIIIIIIITTTTTTTTTIIIIVVVIIIIIIIIAEADTDTADSSCPHCPHTHLTHASAWSVTSESIAQRLVNQYLKHQHTPDASAPTVLTAPAHSPTALGHMRMQENLNFNEAKNNFYENLYALLATQMDKLIILEPVLVVDQLLSGKALESDVIPAEVCKHGGPQIMYQLTTLFQEM